MHISNRIFKLRKLKGIKRKEMCQGIISYSHYCNIEARRYEPPDDILSLLANRLNVPKFYLLKHKEEDHELGTYITKLRCLVDEELIRDATELAELITKKYPYISSVYQEAYFQLLQCYLYIKRNDKGKVIKLFENEFLNMQNEINLDEMPSNFKELYLYISGVLSYYYNNFPKSYRYFVDALKILDKNTLIADVTHNAAMVLLKMQDKTNAITFAKDALTLYLFDHKWQKAASTYNLLGVVYWEIRDIQRGEDMLIKALDLADTHGYKVVKERIYHNLGLINKSKTNYQKSLEYFQLSLALKKKLKSNSVVLTFRSILELYLEQGLLHEFDVGMEEAKPLCHNEMDLYHLKMIQIKKHLKEGLMDCFVSESLECIDYFIHKKMWKNVFKLSKEMGKYYQENRKYKLATEYFSRSLEAYENIFLEVNHENVK